jgi:hypothetical protein
MQGADTRQPQSGTQTPGRGRIGGHGRSGLAEHGQHYPDPYATLGLAQPLPAALDMGMTPGLRLVTAARQTGGRRAAPAHRSRGQWRLVEAQGRRQQQPPGPEDLWTPPIKRARRTTDTQVAPHAATAAPRDALVTVPAAVHLLRSHGLPPRSVPSPLGALLAHVGAPPLAYSAPGAWRVFDAPALPPSFVHDFWLRLELAAHARASWFCWAVTRYGTHDRRGRAFNAAKREAIHAWSWSVPTASP